MRRRRRSGRATNANRVAACYSDITSASHELLNKYLVPVYSSFPLGSMENSSAKITTLGKEMYAYMRRASPKFAALQDHINSQPPWLQATLCGAPVARDGTTMNLRVAIHLDDVQPLSQYIPVYADDPNMVSANTMPSKTYYFDKCYGYSAEHPTCVITDMQTGEHAFSGAVGSQAYVLGRKLSEDQYKAVRRKHLHLVIFLSIPVTSPVGKGIWIDAPQAYGENMRKQSEWDADGYFTDPTQTFHILPFHPDYDRIKRWAYLAMRVCRTVTDAQNLVTYLCENTETVGQLYRVFPEVRVLMSDEAQKRLAEAKVRSPLPYYMLPYESFKPENELRRLKYILKSIDEVSALLTQAILMPPAQHNPLHGIGYGYAAPIDSGHKLYQTWN